MTSTWHPFTPMQEWTESTQISIQRARGSYLYDTKGAKYLDGTSSLWTNVHGHNHPTINQAICDQLGKVAHTTLLGLASPVADELSDKLVNLTPPGLQHVFYSDSGSSSVEIALKQAFQYWQLTGNPQKTQFVHIQHGYHGDTLGAVGVGGIPLFHRIYGPLITKSHSIPSPSPHAQSLPTTHDAQAESLQALRILLGEKHEQIAALIIEPLVQGAAGMLVHPKGFLAAVADICREHNVLLIVDEVATGFGRTGRLFACEHEHVSPDFLCLAKGITGGYLPLAATLSSTRIFEAFLGSRTEEKTFFHGHTYTGNALACAAALASLQVFRDEDTIATLPEKISVLRQALSSIENHQHVGSIRQCGMMVGIELVARRSPKTLFPAKRSIGHAVCMEARKHGVIIRNIGDVIILVPQLSISVNDIKVLVNATEIAITETIINE